MAQRSSKSIPSETRPLDVHVDGAFGEPVVLKPMMKLGGGYRESVPDPSRPPVITVGIYDQSRGAVENTSGGVGGSFIHNQATVLTSLSIRVEPILQCGLKEGDRVTFPQRDETYEVSHIFDDPGGRPDVNLLRVLEDE